MIIYNNAFNLFNYYRTKGFKKFILNFKKFELAKKNEFLIFKRFVKYKTRRKQGET